ncbi:helix-turn-helix domain-containing protein [Mycobacterium colombiense]
MPGKSNKFPHTTPKAAHAPPLTPMLDIHKVAALLDLHHTTVWRMARDGRIPARFIANKWRFRREDIAELMGASI